MVAMAGFSLVYYPSSSLEPTSSISTTRTTWPSPCCSMWGTAESRSARLPCPRGARARRYVVPAPAHAHDSPPRRASSERAAGPAGRCPRCPRALCRRRRPRARVEEDRLRHSRSERLRHDQECLERRRLAPRAQGDGVRLHERAGPLSLPARPASGNALLPRQPGDPTAHADRSRPSASAGGARSRRLHGRRRSGIPTELGRYLEPGAALRRQSVPPGRVRAGHRRGRLRAHEAAPGRREG